MADKNNCTPTPGNVPHFAKALLLEGGIANSKNFIDQENFRLQMGCNCKSQAHLHSRAVMLEWSIYEFFNLGERHHLVKLAVHLTLAHAQDCAAKKRVLPAGEFRMKAGANLK